MVVELAWMKGRAMMCVCMGSGGGERQGEKNEKGEMYGRGLTQARGSNPKFL